MIGVNTDPGNFTDLDKLAADIAAAGFTWVRSVAKPESQKWIAACHGAGLKVLLVVARESLQGTFEQTATFYSKFDADWIQCGNEEDQNSPSSWTLPPSEIIRLGECFRTAMPEAYLVMGGLVSGQPDYLRG